MMISEEHWWRPQAAMVAAGVATAALLVVLAPTEAQAQVAAAVGGSLDTIVDKFKEATSQWESAIKKAAISLTWAFRSQVHDYGIMGASFGCCSGSKV